MKTISLVSQKGGAGKTIIAVNLAAYASLRGKAVAIADIDSQASSCVWNDEREEDDISVVSVQASRLGAVLKAAKDNAADLCFIDTSPNSESATLAAAKNSDFVLIPCRPSLADIKAIENTVSIVRIANKRAGIVINAAKNKSVANDAILAVKGYGLPISPVVIADRIAFSHSFTEGLGVNEYDPKSKAANEIQRLYKWICKQV